jgi:hypothetical protein
MTTTTTRRLPDGNAAELRVETPSGVALVTLAARDNTGHPARLYHHAAWVVRPEGADPDGPFVMLEKHGTDWAPTLRREAELALLQIAGAVLRRQPGPGR